MDNLQYVLRELISVQLPNNWTLEDDGEIVTIYANKNGKGALQMSIYTVNSPAGNIENLVNENLDAFLKQNKIDCSMYNRNTIVTPDQVFMGTRGYTNDRDFMEIWFVSNGIQMLLATYISSKENKEVGTVKKIIYSIGFI